MNILDEILASITPEDLTQTVRSMGIAGLIADAIEAKGMTHREFAKKIGKNPSDIPILLRGHYNYTIQELTQIEFVLGTPLFFSKDLGWASVKQSAYQEEPEPLSMAAEP